MSRLTPIGWRELVQRLRELGFEGPCADGRHPQMRREHVTVIIPNPHEGDIGVGLLQRIPRQAGVSREEWLGRSTYCCTRKRPGTSDIAWSSIW
jgi:predicted RNA binding protein YcfA (HicA-like mRNA interferase family)